MRSRGGCLPGEEASRIAGKLARKYPVRQRFLIPLLHRTRRWQMVHYELLTYEAAAAITYDRGASGLPDRSAIDLRSKEPGADQITVVRSPLLFRGHEKVPVCGQVYQVPARDQLRVPILARHVYRQLRPWTVTVAGVQPHAVAVEHE